MTRFRARELWQQFDDALEGKTGEERGIPVNMYQAFKDTLKLE